MTRRWVLLLVLPFLMGQTVRDVTIRDLTLGDASGTSNEVMPPTTLTEPATNTWRSTDDANCWGIASTCLGYVDDGYQTTYDDKRLCNDEDVVPTTETLRFDFDTPASSPTATTDAQQIRIAFFSTNAICNPLSDAQADSTFDIQVWDGDSLELIADGISCTSATVTETTYDWTYEGTDGSDVYVIFTDNGNGETGTNRRRCAIEDIEWYAETS